MAKHQQASGGTDRGSVEEEQQVCGLPPIAPRPLESPIDPRRARLIRSAEKKWVNGTVLRFCFLDRPARMQGAASQKDAVRRAFTEWKELGIGLEFREVQDPADAELRIGFDRNDGSWSYVGRDAVDYAPEPSQATINYGWDLTTPYGRDTALHEIGHALGFPHEHQNPNSGIVWNEARCYAYFAGAPNFWNHQTTYHNVIRKLEPGEVEGSRWDRDSIMHYRFEAGLIDNPSGFKDKPLVPAPGLSEVDIAEVRRFYPPLEPELPSLDAWQLKMVDVEPGEQLNWKVQPSSSRTYTIQTLGALDTVMVLFEVVNGETRYLDGDDDSGAALNAKIQVRLFAGREYILRLRLYSVNASGGGGILMY